MRRRLTDMNRIEAAKAVVEAARPIRVTPMSDDGAFHIVSSNDIVRLHRALSAYDAAEDVGVEVVANEIGCALFGEAREDWGAYEGAARAALRALGLLP